MIATTLKKIRKHRPFGLRRGSSDIYSLLHTNLGKGYGRNTPIKFSQIIESVGVVDAIWCLQSICPDADKEVRLFAADCAERVLYIYEEEYPDDGRPRNAIQSARDYVKGSTSKAQMAAAGAAAWAAADCCVGRARAAAWSAARVAGGIADAASIAGSAAFGARAAAGIAGPTAADDEREKQAALLISRFG